MKYFAVLCTLGCMCCGAVFWFWLLPQQKILIALRQTRIESMKPANTIALLAQEKILAPYAAYQTTGLSLNAFIAALTQTIQIAHVRLKKITIQNTGTKNKILVSAEAPFLPLMHFLTALQSIPFLFTIDSLQFENVQHVLSFTMVLFYEN